MHDTFLLAQQIPQFGTYEVVMLISRILHILGAIILVGGLFYLWAVVTPASPLPDREGQGEGSVYAADQFFGGRRAAWAMWVGIASLLLLAAGLWNFINMVKANQLHFTYHILGAVKILLGLALMGLAALLAGRTAAADSIRRRWRLWITVAVLIGILTAALGSFMRSYPRTVKPSAQADNIEEKSDL